MVRLLFGRFFRGSFWPPFLQPPNPGVQQTRGKKESALRRLALQAPVAIEVPGRREASDRRTCDPRVRLTRGCSRSGLLGSFGGGFYRQFRDCAFFGRGFWVSLVFGFGVWAFGEKKRKKMALVSQLPPGLNTAAYTHAKRSHFPSWAFCLLGKMDLVDLHTHTHTARASVQTSRVVEVGLQSPFEHKSS